MRASSDVQVGRGLPVFQELVDLLGAYQQFVLGQHDEVA